MMLSILTNLTTMLTPTKNLNLKNKNNTTTKNNTDAVPSRRTSGEKHTTKSFFFVLKRRPQQLLPLASARFVFSSGSDATTSPAGSSFSFCLSRFALVVRIRASYAVLSFLTVFFNANILHRYVAHEAAVSIRRCEGQLLSPRSSWIPQQDEGSP